MSFSCALTIFCHFQCFFKIFFELINFSVACFPQSVTHITPVKGSISGVVKTDEGSNHPPLEWKAQTRPVLFPLFDYLWVLVEYICNHASAKQVEQSLLAEDAEPPRVFFVGEGLGSPGKRRILRTRKVSPSEITTQRYGPPLYSSSPLRSHKLNTREMRNPPCKAANVQFSAAFVLFSLGSAIADACF